MVDKTQKAGKKRTSAGWGALYLALSAGTLLIFLLNLGVGTASIPVGDILRILAGRVDAGETKYLILMRIRFPRALASLAGGAALAVAGFLLQTFFSNPIVEPYVLGISSGSSLFVGLVFLGGFTFGVRRITPMFLFLGAFLGAMAVMSIVLAAARKVKSVITLLIIGMMAGYVCSAATSILTAFAEKEQIQMFTMWSMGSFSGFTWDQVGVLYAIVLPVILFSFCLAKPLNALNMGDLYADSMGINVKTVRCALILLSSVLTAAVTAFAGPVSFIGLAVPHICRITFHTADSRLLIPAVTLGGGLMAGLCDFAAKNLLAPMELPLGAITAVIGAPLVVYLMTRRGEA